MPEQDTLDQQGADTQDPSMQDTSGDWRGSLDSTLKEHPSLAKYKTVNDLASAYLNAQKFIGREKLPIPKDETEKEVYDMIFDRLGRPKDPEGYKLEAQIPQDVPINQDLIKNFKKIARDSGLLPQQAQALYKWFVDSSLAEYSQANEKRQESAYKAETSLRREYGKAFEQNIGIAKKVIKQYADPETAKLFDSEIGNDPRMVRFLVNIGKKMGSHGFIEGRSPGIMGPAEAKSEIKKILGNQDHPYWKQHHPEHDDAVAHMSSLQQMASVDTN